MAETYKTFELSLDMKITRSSGRVHKVYAGDNGNKFIITLTDDGTAVDLSACRVAAVFANKSGSAIQTSWGASISIAISGTSHNIVTITLLTGSFSSGQNSCQLQIYSGALFQTLVTTPFFNFNGEKAAVNDDTIIATTEYTILIDMIADVTALQAAYLANVTDKLYLVGTTAPTTSTVGARGQRYINTTTGYTYVCTAIAESVYTWVQNGNTSGIIDSAVTNAKLANMDNNTIKGNVSGSAAAPADLTVAQVRGIITEGTSEVDAIADGDKFIIEDVSATAGVRTKHVLVSAVKTALALVFAGITHASRHASGGADTLSANDIGAIPNDGWASVSVTWSYASATTITVPTGAASIYSVGDKIKLTQTTVKYFYIIGVADTVLTVTGGLTYTLANAAIASPCYSHVANPLGFPQYFPYVPTGISASNVSIQGRFSIANRRVIVDMLIDFTGAITFTTMPTLPIAVSSDYKAAGVTCAAGVGSYFDLGTLFSPGGLFPCVKASSTTVTITGVTGTNISATSPCTWANGDFIELHFNYEI